MKRNEPNGKEINILKMSMTMLTTCDIPKKFPPYCFCHAVTALMWSQFKTHYFVLQIELRHQTLSATMAMPSLLLSTLCFLSASGLTGATSLRERSLAIAPRTVYSFSYNYADSACSQLVSAGVEVFYDSTATPSNNGCSRETSDGKTWYFKQVLTETNQYESCATGISVR